MRRLCALSFTVALACSGTPSDEAADLFSALPSGEPIVSSTNLGPVRAEVRVRPATPRLGDTVYLELRVSAPSEVDIVMPESGEALGRFSIVDYDWRESSDGDLRVREQIYQLQAAASGKVRLPQLRIEVTDRRPGAEASGEARELLTDEILLDVAPINISPDDAVLRARTMPLEIKPLRPWHHLWFWLLLAGILVAIAVGIAARLFKRAATALRRSAYEVAIERLTVLREAGTPLPDELDAWYVELSSVIRSYLEGRFAVRAPELTTEEFIRVAHRSAGLSESHRDTLGAFLAGCDRVKFAGHRPSSAEQAAALDAAFAFVSETRPAEVAV